MSFPRYNSGGDIPDLKHHCKSCDRVFAEWRLHTYLSGNQGYCCPWCGNSKPKQSTPANCVPGQEG